MQKARRPSLTQISGLLQGAMRRHGVAKQVTAAIIVDRANEILDEMLSDPMLRQDVCALSYKDNILVIGCVNAAASYDMEGLAPQILLMLTERVPEANIHSIVARVQIERGRY